MRPEDYWIADHGELVAFARVLESACAFVHRGDVIDYFAEPHKWSPEHERWIAMGRPESVDDIEELRREPATDSESEQR